MPLSDAAYDAFQEFCDSPGEPLAPRDLADAAHALLCLSLSQLPDAQRHRLLDEIPHSLRRGLSAFIDGKPARKLMH
jgi:hypothetical protein